MRGSAWDEQHDPDRLLAVLAGSASLRKLRLVACAFVRYVPYHPDGRTLWELLPTAVWFRPGQPGSRYNLDCHEAVAVAERQADGMATADEWEIACGVASGAKWCAEVDFEDGACYRTAAAGAVEAATEDTRARLLGRLRGFYRYPGRRRAVPHLDHAPVMCELLRDILLAPQRRKPIDPAWLTSTVRELATAAYEARRFDGLPALADALKAAGCTDRAVLRHCREHRFHARGCWALDRVLSRE